MWAGCPGFDLGGVVARDSEEMSTEANALSGDESAGRARVLSIGD